MVRATFAGGIRGSKQIALTYDDGPNDLHTLKLLDVLAKHSVRATFFMIGRYVQQRPDIARAVAEAGHVIGNHTFTHPLLIFKSEAQTRAELVDCHRGFAGRNRRAFESCSVHRGEEDGPRHCRIARELGLQTIMWNVTAYDWNAPSAAVIENRIVRQIRGGDVILLHDGGHRALGADRAQTVMATDNLIRRYQDRKDTSL